MNMEENRNVEIDDERLDAVNGGMGEGKNKPCKRCGGTMKWRPGTSFYLCDNCGKQEHEVH